MDNVAELLNRVQVACRAGKFEDAHDICSRAEAEGSVPVSDIYLFRSIIYKRNTDRINEKYWIEESLKIEPEDKSTLFSYCTCLISLGHYEAAIGKLNDLQAIDRRDEDQPFTDMANLQKSYCYFQLGDLKEAKAAFQKSADTEKSMPITTSPFFTVYQLKNALGL